MIGAYHVANRAFVNGYRGVFMRKKHEQKSFKFALVAFVVALLTSLGATPAFATDAEARSPVGPCSQQNGGIRVSNSGLDKTYQNCNSYTVSLKIYIYPPGVFSAYWDECKTYTPGQARGFNVFSINPLSWAYC